MLVPLILDLQNAVVTPPVILVNPVNQSTVVGSTASFAVVATGTGLSYQWTKNGGNIAGATSSTYVTPAEVLADNGALFACVVTNSAGSVTSTSATLTVTSSGGGTPTVVTPTTAISYETRALIDRAYGRCRLRPEQITDEMIDRAKWNLYLILSDMSNTGTPVWCLQKTLLSLTQGQPLVTLPVGTVDVRNAYLRTQGNITPDHGPTIGTTYLTWDFSLTGAQNVNTLGLYFPGTPPTAITVQTSPDNSTWTTVTTQNTWGTTAGLYWYDLAGSSQAIYWRATAAATSTSTSVQPTTVYLASNLSEIMMARLNADSYESYPNKAFQGRPLQFWLDRQLQPVMNLWPTPDAASALLPLVVYRQRYIADVGTLPQVIEVPQYWYESITWKLAANLSWDTPEVDPKLCPALEAKADSMMRLAWAQDRDKAPIQLQYGIGVYTR